MVVLVERSDETQSGACSAYPVGRGQGPARASDLGNAIRVLSPIVTGAIPVREPLSALFGERLA
jgi:hypothetical protein